MPVVKCQYKNLGKQWLTIKRFSNQKSFPPVIKRSETKEVDEKPTKTSRDIFGATILPQNLSFENTKKLSYNQIRLEDIPLVDENEVAEAITAKKVANTKEKKLEIKKNDDVGVVVIQTDLIRKTKNSLAGKISSTFSIKNHSSLYTLQNLGRIFKYFTRETPLIPFLQYVKDNAIVPFKNFAPVVNFPEILGNELVLISRPDHVSAVFEQDKRHPINSVLDSIQRCRMQKHYRNSKMVCHLTDEWANIKQSLNLVGGKKMDEYFEGIEEAGEKFARRIKVIRNDENEVPDDFLYEINKWSLECLCLILFDDCFEFFDFDKSSSSSSVSRLLYYLTAATKNLCELEKGFQLWRFVNTSSLSSLGHKCDIIESAISELIEKAQLNIINKQQTKNFVNLKNLSYIESLLLEKDTSPDDIISIILDALLIGTNTMSTALGFLLYHISINFQVQSRIHKEVKEVLPEKYSRLEYEQLGFLKYTQACLKESLRLKLPIPYLTRIVSQDVTLKNYQIRKGTFVLMATQLEVLKEENFDEPFQFLPERWFDPSVSHPFVTLPLSHFYANNFQRYLAETSVWVCAALIIKHFFVEYLHGEIEATNSVISFPNKPLKFVFTDRTA